MLGGTGECAFRHDSVCYSLVRVTFYILTFVRLCENRFNGSSSISLPSVISLTPRAHTYYPRNVQQG